MRIFICLFLVLFAPLARAEPLLLLTEEYRPFSYRDAATFKGSSVEQVEIIMRDAEIDYSIEMKPWARAFSLAQLQPMTCVFTTVHNEERHAKFKWVEPILSGRTILVRRAGSGINPKTLQEASRYIVGTQIDDFTEPLLKSLHFDKLDLASDFDLSMKKLLNGRIDLMPISEKYYFKLRDEGAKVESVLVLADRIYSIACNPNVPDDIIARMQASLDRLIADGTQAAIFRKYGLDKADP